MNKTKKDKKVGKIIGNVLMYLFLAFSLFVTILAISANQNGDGISYVGDYAFMPVLTNSMEPTINTGDVIVVKKLSLDQVNELQVDDIITFYAEEETGEQMLITHRISEVRVTEDGSTRFTTWGDNREVCPVADLQERYAGDVRCLYTGVRIPKLGTFMTFLKTRTGFGVCILLPMLALFIYELVNVILAFLQNKNKNAKVISESEEEAIKEKAIQEYLKKQAEEKSSEE